MGGSMTVVRTSTDLHPLCYEHQIEMRPVQILLKSDASPTLAHACPVSDCLIHYSKLTGYFIPSVPTVACPRHEAPMYLAEVKPERRSFRLWKCPQVGCRATRTNEEHLLAS